jgi:uncharacterized protein (TIGR02246 family)
MATARAASVDELVGVLRDSWNRHDINTYVSLFGPDAVYVNAVGTVWRGYEEIEQGHQRLHGTVFRESRITSMTHRETAIAPGVLACVCDWEMFGAKPPEGWRMSDPRCGILTLILVRGEDGWRIAAGQNTEKLALPVP